MSLLSVTPGLSQCIHNALRSADGVKHHVLCQLLLNNPLPDHIFNVKVQYRLSDISDFPVVHTGAHRAHRCTLRALCAHCAHCRRASKSYFRHAFSVFLLHSVELLG